MGMGMRFLSYTPILLWDKLSLNNGLFIQGLQHGRPSSP
uniref:Uncharacterized protein n=1 Tax=Vitis vinifera TaxID=29760 RepID=F6H4K0_VITVI